ncbi:MAG: hypothetical protein K2Q09_02025, partial [Phycisphaerales bacterium]|nr:hypothetical protein [Phycisphaerales bacterium]
MTRAGGAGGDGSERAAGGGAGAAAQVNGGVIPADPDALAEFVRKEMGVGVASSALVEGNDGAMAYLVHSFFEGRFSVLPDGRWVDNDARPGGRPPGDCVVWANRGGGKTFLGAVATALDMLFKPTIEVRILGGSAEQSRRMHEHLRAIFERENFSPLLDGRTTDSRVRLVSGSRAEVLSHSERSVRGVRVQKLRCDEVDLFDRELWEAAQLVTRSKRPIPGPWGKEVRGVIEVMSTMHVPMGLMWSVTRGAVRTAEWVGGRGPGERRAGEPGAEARGRNGRGGVEAEAGSGGDGVVDPRASAQGSLWASRTLFKWGVIDALEPCGPEHVCQACTLREECRGRAKGRAGGGHMTVRDARVLKQRASAASWRSEMLCLEPSRSGCVFPEFSAAAHVVAHPGELSPGGELVAGMDFGVRAPTVIVWAHVSGAGVVTVIDEYAEEGRTLGQHVSAIEARAWGRPAWVGIDPAGQARNEQTGVSNAAAMRNTGLIVKARRCGVGEGLEAVRSRLAPRTGPGAAAHQRAVHRPDRGAGAVP